MASSGPQMYPTVQQFSTGSQQQQAPLVQYQHPPPFSNSNAYSSPASNVYANSLISAYGIPPPPPPVPPQPYGYEAPAVGAKRHSDDVLQAVDLLSKRPRPDSGGSLAYYPQRPGEKLCSFYMTTRSCSFGVTCRFDHPSWVPYGGIPNWKEVSGASTTGTTTPTTDPGTLPQRTGEQNCAFYMKTGECKYGPRCRFNHPKDRQAAPSDSSAQSKDDGVPGLQNGAAAGLETEGTAAASTAATVPGKITAGGEKPAGKSSFLNTKGLPIRQSEPDCTFYIKTGSCKFGASCRFNHPEVIKPGARSTLLSGPAQSGAMSYTTEYGNSLHPQRPGGQDCTYFLKTGDCSFGATCKFHHPANRQASSILKAIPKLTLAGLPRREGETSCAYYMKTGSCKYGSTCRFDHPPPAEVAARAAADATRVETPMMENYDVHHPPGVPMQYVDLNPSFPFPFPFPIPALSASTHLAPPIGSLSTTPVPIRFLSIPPGPIGSLSTPPTLIGSFSTTPPIGSFTTTPPIGSFSTTPPIGSFSTTPPIGSFSTTPGPLGSFSTTPAPMGSFSATPAPIGSSDTTPAPIGSSDTTPAPIGSSSTTPVPIGPSSNTPVPVGSLSSTPLPDLSSSAVPLPIGSISTPPAQEGPTEPSSTS